MRSYTVHCWRYAIGNPDAEAAATIFVRDGFSWIAFIVPLAWTLYNSMWAVLLALALALVGLNLAIVAAGLPEFVNAIMTFVVHFLFGADARDLHRWTLSRRGYDVVSVLVAENQDEVEIRYFQDWCDGLSANQYAYVAGEETKDFVLPVKLDHAVEMDRLTEMGPNPPAPSTNPA
jgi:hypothetical protein